MKMMHKDTKELLSSRALTNLPMGPVALIFNEDGIEINSTLLHHAQRGFDALVVFGFGGELPEGLGDVPVLMVEQTIAGTEEVSNTVNACMPALDGRWVYYCFNAEYLFFPFCDTRSIRDLTAFMSTERRRSIFGIAVDLYAKDVAEDSNAVNVEDCCFDGSGYYALGRWDPETSTHLDRQIDVYGALRWRFAQHFLYERRNIDRVPLFVADSALEVDGRMRLSESEMNSYQCQWHHNPTVAIASFRVAKALRLNPSSAAQIDQFIWDKSQEFDWTPQQFLDFGFMEPGQWF